MRPLIAVGVIAAIIVTVAEKGTGWRPMELPPPTTVMERFPAHQEDDTPAAPEEKVSYAPTTTPRAIVDPLVEAVGSAVAEESPDSTVDYIAIYFDTEWSATVAWAWTTPDDGQYRLAGVRWTRSRDGRWSIYQEEPPP